MYQYITWVDDYGLKEMTHQVENLIPHKTVILCETHNKSSELRHKTVVQFRHEVCVLSFLFYNVLNVSI